jgi:hypothetical protein
MAKWGELDVMSRMDILFQKHYGAFSVLVIMFNTTST